VAQTGVRGKIGDGEKTSVRAGDGGTIRELHRERGRSGLDVGYRSLDLDVVARGAGVGNEERGIYRR
jgi:hypothetical protein